MKTEKRSNRRWKIGRLLCCIISAILMWFLLIPPITAKASNDLWLTLKLQDWMKYLPDSMQLSQINIPGTHDSGTYGIVWAKADIARTQFNTIEEQLDGGIRYFDVRLRLAEATEDEPYKMVLCHGDDDHYADCYTTRYGWTELTLGHVVGWANNFVTAHPNEVVIIELSAECNKDKVKPLIRQIMDGAYHIKGHDATYSNVISYTKGEQVPSLGEVRGKVILLTDGLGDDSLSPITTYENNYHVDNGDDVIKKANRLIKVLNDSKRFNQQYFFTRDSFINDTPRNTDEVPQNVAAPKHIGTNITDIKGAASAIFGYGPLGCFKLLYFDNGGGTKDHPERWADFQKVSLNPSDATGNKRTGWWSMDFPQNKWVQDIVDSNKVPVKHYEIDMAGISSGYKTLEELPVEVSVVLENGYEMPCYKMKWQSNSQSYLLDFGYYTASEIKTVRLKHKTDASYKAELEKMDIDTNPQEAKGILVEKRTDYYNVRKIEDNELKEFKVGVFFDDDKENPASPLPVDPQEFLDEIGKFSLEYPDSESGSFSSQVIFYPGDGRFCLKEIKKLGTSQKPYYELIVMVPAYDKNYNPINYQFKGFSVFNRDGAYTLSKFTDSAFWLHMKNTEETFWDPIPINWNDGKDRYQMRQHAIDQIISGGIHHVAKVFSDGEIVVDETISPENIQVTENGEILVKVNKYGKDNKELIHTYRLVDVDYYNRSGDNKYTPQTESLIKIIWDDDDDVVGLRPETVIPHFFNMVADDYDLNTELCEENEWENTVSMPTFIENGKENMYYERGVYYYTDPYLSEYEKSIIIEQTQLFGSLDKSPRYIITLTLKLKPEYRLEYEDIRGDIQWNDGNLLIDHTTLAPQIGVLRNGEALTLRKSVQRLNDDCTGYWFEPVDDFQKTKSGDPTVKYSYDIQPLPLDGYIGEKIGGYHVRYTRTVSVSGTVSWPEGQVKSQTQPTVTLLRDGKKYGTEIQTEDWEYVFENLPIADTDGVPYNYSIEATLDDPEAVIIYDQIQQDSDTGNVIADARIVPKEEEIPVEIPIKLILKDAPDPITDSFGFTLTFPDEIAEPMSLELNPENGFEDIFSIPDMPKPDRIYTVKISQDKENRKNYWKYDDTVKEVTLTIRYINGKPVAQIDIGEEDVLTFTNVYAPTEGTVVLKASKKIENRLEKFDVPVPEREFLFQLKDAEENLIDSETITGEGEVQFKELTLSDPGEYEYLISESWEDAAGWIYDDNTYPVIVTVTDEGGQLSASVDTVPEITNIFTMAMTDVNVKVVWIDNDNASKTRPEVINISLKDGSEVLKQETVSADEWEKTIKGLPLYEEEGLVEIGLEAEALNGYTMKISGNAADGFIITYTAEKAVPLTGDGNTPGRMIAIMFSAMLTIILAFVFLKKKEEL